MKKLLLVFITMLACLQVIAQDQSERPQERPRRHHHHTEQHGAPPFSYIGFSAGINNPAGAIGFDFNIPVSKYWVMGAGGGFTGWGNQLHFDAKYFLRRHQHGWALGGGLIMNSGDNHYKTRPEPTSAGVKENVYLDLRTQRNLFFAVYHYWNIGRRYNRFFAEAGWSTPLVNRKFNQLSGDPLSQSAVDRVDRMAPGGLILGCGFSFGLHH